MNIKDLKIGQNIIVVCEEHRECRRYNGIGRVVAISDDPKVSFHMNIVGRTITLNVLCVERHP